jgi:hypothetical protein
MTRTDSDGLHRQHLDHVAPEDEETYLCNLAYTLSGATPAMKSSDVRAPLNDILSRTGFSGKNI